MFHLIAWRIRRLVDVRQTIREMDIAAEFVGDDLGVRRNDFLSLVESPLNRSTIARNR